MTSRGKTSDNTPDEIQSVNRTADESSPGTFICPALATINHTASAPNLVILCNGFAGKWGEVVADQFVLADVITVRVYWVIVSEPAAATAGHVGDEGQFGASSYVGPAVAESTVSIATSDVPVVNFGHLINSRERYRIPRDYDDGGR